ncbi:MAG TPA: hypothetical protein VF532_11645 [Candidatus Angelobacter sp.]
MKGEQNARSTWVLYAAVIACCCSMVPGCKKASQASGSAGAANLMARTEDPATRELRAIGDKVAMAVLAKDVKTLLEYDHDPEDEVQLKNQSGDLYCYLFNSGCTTEAKRRPVYELFSTSPKLGIEATVARVQGKDYGLLMFYDKSQISGEELYSPDFQCTDKALKGTASWRFIQADGKWSTSTLFEYKTERPCKQGPGNQHPAVSQATR